MNTKTVKEKVEKIIRKQIKNKDVADYIVEESNKMPPTLLDDDIADWEHDNLVKNG